jgi:hypothetical protein
MEFCLLASKYICKLKHFAAPALPKSYFPCYTYNMEPKKLPCGRIPYGISNFEDLITGGYAYVDKTRYIELLENEPNPYQIFIRPRKFGKSLLLTTLNAYYDVNNVDKFESLFGGLYIGSHPTPKRGQYAVLNFDFSGLDTHNEKNFINSFNESIQSALAQFLTIHRNFPNAERILEEVLFKETGPNAVKKVFRFVIEADIGLFVIIDEYDHFANDLFAMGTKIGNDVYRKMVSANGVVRDFYEALKEGTKTVVKRIFITGISPVMINDLTSGFNIAINTTLFPHYNEMLGFTLDEVNTLAQDTGIAPQSIDIDIEKYYNGYLFSMAGKERVYNPAMVLFYFYQIRSLPPDMVQIVDPNLRTDYQRLQLLLTNEKNHKRLLAVAKDNGIYSEIAMQFSMDSMHDDEYFVSLLFYMGLLTVDKMDDIGGVRLKIPNYSVRTLYWEYIWKLTLDVDSDVMTDVYEMREAINALAFRGELEPYIKYISENIFVRLSNRDLIKFDERYIKIMLLNGLFQSNLYFPTSERETQGGYVDMYLERNPARMTVKYEWVWELKYLKESDVEKASDDTVAAAVSAAIEEGRTQIARYQADPHFAGRADVKYAVLVFIGKKRYVLKEIA